MVALLSGDLLALGKRFFKIRLHLCVHSGVIEIHGVFKMQIQAAEVQIDCADNSLLRVGQIDLGVDEARRIFEDTHACARQLLIVCARDRVDIPFVRDAGRDDAHVDACFCRDAQRRGHFIVQDQIRRHDPHPLLRRGNDGLQNRRADVLVVERTVGKRLEKARAAPLFRIVCAEAAHILLRPVNVAPEGQKHDRH